MFVSLQLVVASQTGAPEMILSDNASQLNAASKPLEAIWSSVVRCEDVQSYVLNS